METIEKKKIETEERIKMGIQDVKLRGATGVYRFNKKGYYCKMYVSKYFHENFKVLSIYIRLKGFRSLSKWLFNMVVKEIRRIQSGENEQDLKEWEISKKIYIDFKKSSYKKEFIDKD